MNLTYPKLVSDICLTLVPESGKVYKAVSPAEERQARLGGPQAHPRSRMSATHRQGHNIKV